MKTLLIVMTLVLGLQTSQAKEKAAIQEVKMQVTDKGFEPNEIKVKPGTHVVLKITRTSEESCGTEIKLKEKKIKAELPLNQEVTVDAGILKKGEIHFACGMDMMSGHIIAE